MIASIRHTGIVVNDIDKSLNFWCNTLGFKLIKKMTEQGSEIDLMIGLKNVKVTTAKLSDANGNLLELLKFHSHPDIKCWEGKPYSTGITHIAIKVDDFDETIAKFKELGIKLENKPIISRDKKVKVVYIRCIEGLLIEIVQVLKK